VLGAARTGSGKTLAFLVPLLERLYRSGWSAVDGLGALVIAPTRELAVQVISNDRESFAMFCLNRVHYGMQIFDVLRVVGKGHAFSAGLIIGGKDLAAEQQRIGSMNILICTPGILMNKAFLSRLVSRHHCTYALLNRSPSAAHGSDFWIRLLQRASLGFGRSMHRVARIPGNRFRTTVAPLLSHRRIESWIWGSQSLLTRYLRIYRWTDKRCCFPRLKRNL